MEDPDGTPPPRDAAGGDQPLWRDMSAADFDTVKPKPPMPDALFPVPDGCGTEDLLLP
jgi:hypothetical protein